MVAHSSEWILSFKDVLKLEVSLHKVGDTLLSVGFFVLVYFFILKKIGFIYREMIKIRHRLFYFC